MTRAIYAEPNRGDFLLDFHKLPDGSYGSMLYASLCIG